MSLSRNFGIKALALTTMATALVGCGGGGDDGAGDPVDDGAGGGGGGDGSGASGGSSTQTIGGCEVKTIDLSDGAGMVPYVLWTGERFAVAFVQEGRVRVSLVDTSGEVATTADVSAGSGAALPSLSGLGEQIVAMWSEGGNVLYRSLDTSMAMVTDPIVVVETASADPRPTASPLSGDAIASAWMDQPTISAAVVENGTPTDVTEINGWHPAAAGLDGRVGLAWSEGGEMGPLAFALFDSLDTATTVPDSSALIKSVAATGAGFVVAWEESSFEEPHIVVASFDDAGAYDAKTTISPGETSANWPSLALAGDRMALAYYQFRDEGRPDVFLTFVDPASLDVMGEEIRLAEGSKYPSVAFGDGVVGAAYVVQDGPVRFATIACGG